VSVKLAVQEISSKKWWIGSVVVSTLTMSRVLSEASPKERHNSLRFIGDIGENERREIQSRVLNEIPNPLDLSLIGRIAPQALQGRKRKIVPCLPGRVPPLLGSNTGGC